MQVKTEYIKRKGFLTVDGQESPTVTVVGNATTLDVEGNCILEAFLSTTGPGTLGT